MGRGKLKLELIPNPGARMLTFKKRKDSLKKKLKELTTLCDVNGCMIIYGPDPAVEPDVYPEDLNETCRVIADYNSTKGESMTRCKTFGLSDFFTLRKKEELAALQKEKTVAYPTWNETLESVRDPIVLRKLADELSLKAQVVKTRMELLKQERAMDMGSSSTCTDMQPNNPSGESASSMQPNIPRGVLASSFQTQQYMVFNNPSGELASSMQPNVPRGVLASSFQPQQYMDFNNPSGELASSMQPNIPRGVLASSFQPQQYMDFNNPSGELASSFQLQQCMDFLKELQEFNVNSPMANLDYNDDAWCHKSYF